MSLAHNVIFNANLHYKTAVSDESLEKQEKITQ